MAIRDSIRSGAGLLLRSAGDALLTRAGGKAKLAGAPTDVQRPRQLTQQYLRVGGGQTPEDLSYRMRQADIGYMYLLFDFAEEQRNKDCHLGGILYRREQSLSPLSWQIVPTSERPKALRVAAWVEDVLKRLGGSLDDRTDLADLGGVLAHLNSAVFHGFSAQEMLWKRDGRYLLPRGSIPIGARRFIYSQIDGSLRWWDAVGPLTSYPGVDLRKDYPTGRFIVHRPRVNGAIGTREGLIRPLMWASLFRTWSLQDWLRLGELAWKPYRWATYTREMSDEDRTLVEQAMELLVATGWALFTKEVELHLEYAKGSGEQGAQHAALCAYLAAEMSKLVLGATLTVEQGKTGAMALGNVHADVAKSIRDIDARAAETTLFRQLITPLVQLNFGTNTPIPTFRFLTEEGANLDALSAAITRLVGQDYLGLDIPQSWVREEFGIPDPQPGDLLMGGRTAPDPNAPKPEMVPAPSDPSQDGPGDGPVDVVSEKAMSRMIKVYRMDKLRQFAMGRWDESMQRSVTA